MYNYLTKYEFLVGELVHGTFNKVVRCERNYDGDGICVTAASGENPHPYSFIVSDSTDCPHMASTYGKVVDVLPVTDATKSSSDLYLYVMVG